MFFFLNHYPEDEIWLPSDLDANLFAKLPLFYGPYLDSEYTLSFPRSGVLPSGYVIPVKFENLSSDKIAYTLGNGSFQIANGVREGNAVVFDIPVPKKTKGYLTLYIERECVVTFRIDP